MLYLLQHTYDFFLFYFRHAISYKVTRNMYYGKIKNVFKFLNFNMIDFANKAIKNTFLCKA